MKKAGTVAASFAAASSMALPPVVADRQQRAYISCCSSGTSSTASTAEQSNQHQQHGSDQGERKFAPRFDGLRFIETLVTAHR